MLSLVDLAGSERLDKCQASGQRLRETQAINSSLATLGLVIMAISNKVLIFWGKKSDFGATTPKFCHFPPHPITIFVPVGAARAIPQQQADLPAAKLAEGQRQNVSGVFFFRVTGWF